MSKSSGPGRRRQINYGVYPVAMRPDRTAPDSRPGIHPLGYIGAYFAVLGGCDVLVFTGSIGSGIAKTRDEICKNLSILKKTKVFLKEI